MNTTLEPRTNGMYLNNPWEKYVDIFFTEDQLTYRIKDMQDNDEIEFTRDYEY